VNKLKVLDLFSGIGGFSLGLERTGEFETIRQCSRASDSSINRGANFKNN
jgi:site-specific DNA-cytosine methylase